MLAKIYQKYDSTKVKKCIFPLLFKSFRVLFWRYLLVVCHQFIYICCVQIDVHIFTLFDMIYAYLDFSHPQTSLKAIRYYLSNQVDNYEPVDVHINNNSVHCSDVIHYRTCLYCYAPRLNVTIFVAQE